MEWPKIVHASEVQTRLIHDGMPVDRAMSVTSELKRLGPGGKFRVERSQGDLYLYALVNAGYFAVASE